MVISTFFLIVGFFCLIQLDAKRKQIDLITFCIFLAIPYFGIWPFIIITTSEIKPVSEYSTVIINVIIFTSFLGLWLGNKFLKRLQKLSSYRSLVNLELYIRKVKEIPFRHFIYLECFCVGFIFYGYLRYGIIKSFTFDQVSAIGISLPSWYLAIFATLQIFIFLLVSALAIKSVDSSQSSLTQACALLLAIIISLLFGRASFITALSVCYLFYLKIKGKHFATPRLAIAGLVSLLFIVATLNFFQQVRSALLFSVTSNGNSVVSQFQHNLRQVEVTKLLKVDHIGKSLNSRPSVWKFNEMIYSWQFVRPAHASLPYGYLLANSWLMLVPRTIWHEKPPNNMQKNVLFPFYQKPFFKFQAPSLLGYVLADFSLLAPVVFPILMLMFLFIVSQVLRLFYSSRLAYIIIVSGASYSMMSIEANYDSYILVIRNVVFFAFIFHSFRLMLKF